MLIIRNMITFIIFFIFIGCGNTTSNDRKSEVETTTLKKSTNIQVEKLTISEELQERRFAAMVLAPLMTSSNSYWINETTLQIDFELLTYSPVEDLSFTTGFYTKDSDEKMSLVNMERDIDSSYVSHSGFGTFALRTGGVRQNKIKISFQKTFSLNEVEKLKPNMYYRVFVGNNYTQDKIGEINSFQWSGAKFTLYVPKILDNNLHHTNSGYVGTNQDNAQRYIQVKGTTVVEPTYNGNWDVPYLSQRSTTYDILGRDNGRLIKEAACAPTSIAMILKFYYPNSHIDMPEIYNAGLQGYYYHNQASNYNSKYMGMMHNVVGNNYLSSIWGLTVETTSNNDIDRIYELIENGPLILYVALGGNREYGHFLVLRGINTNDTNNRDDDIIYINDPWNGGTGGNNREFSYNDFFGTSINSGWFRTTNTHQPYAIAFTPADTVLEREYTVVVDNGNNDFGGNSLYNSFTVDEPYSSEWKFYYGYGAGSWHYPTTTGHSARWRPSLELGGRYEVSIKYHADEDSGNVTYTLYDNSDNVITTATINQYNSTPAWFSYTLSSSSRLADGCYVRATNIEPNTNIDAVKFKYLGE